MRKAVLMSVLLIFLAGCAGFPGFTPQQPTTVAAHTGTQGIVMNFVPNFPPTIMYASSQNPATAYSFILELRNRGSWPTAGTVYFAGFDPNIITNLQPSVPFSSIDGVSTTNIEGGYLQVANPPSGGININMPAQSDVYNTNIVATACYDYHTKASLQTCVDPDPYGLAPKPCIPYGATVSAGQGAPLAVSSVEQDSLPGKVIYKLHVTNSGIGQVVRQYNTANCLQLPYQDQGVFVSDVRLSGQAPLSCTPGPEIILTSSGGGLANGVKGSTTTIVCTFAVTGTQAYTTTLDIDFAYGYVSSIQMPVQIKKIT